MNTAEMANIILAQKSRNREALRMLLDEELSKGDKLFVTRTEMGGSDAYIGSVSLQWLESRVRFAAQLPLFNDKRDKDTGEIIIDKSTIDEIQQRPLDWSRQAPLAQYLAARETHKFPAVLVVISKPWVDDPNSDEWDQSGKAIRPATDFLPLDSQGRVGMLDLSEDVTIYALDGQHRLMGVRGLMDLIRDGKLTRLKKTGKPEKGSPLMIDELAETYSISKAELQSLAAERIGIEFIPSVVPGETRQQARRRVRSVFVHVNRMAAPLSKGQLAQLDEDDGFAIVARHVAVEHPMLSTAKNRIEWNRPNLAERSSALTTLQTVQEMASHFLGQRDEFKNWRQKEKGLIPMRPDDEELAKGFDEFKMLWDKMAKLPSYKKLDQGSDTGSLRRFKHDKNPGEGHLLFRPIGQMVLAHAVGRLIKDNYDLDSIFEKLIRYDKDGGFRMDTASSIWYMVLFDPIRGRMVKSGFGTALAQRLLGYLLGGGIADEKEREKLREDLAKARTITDADATVEGYEDGRGKAKNYDGNWVEPADIELPPVIRK